MLECRKYQQREARRAEGLRENSKMRSWLQATKKTVRTQVSYERNGIPSAPAEDRVKEEYLYDVVISLTSEEAEDLRKGLAGQAEGLPRQNATATRLLKELTRRMRGDGSRRARHYAEENVLGEDNILRGDFAGVKYSREAETR